MDDRGNCRFNFCCAMVLVIYILAAGLSIGFTFPRGGESFDNDCGYGVMVNNSCVCYDYYMVGNNGAPAKCTVAMKSWLTASLLQTFFGFVGSGFWYIGNSLLFGFELGIFVIIVVLIVALCDEKNSDYQEASYCMSLCFASVCGFLMWTVTLAMMWNNDYNDWNGNPLFKR
ncbi:MAG: hypothetical protein Hyperionvirus5_29 [Hyperionvirus sp.]|uniref:Uncharacterized protein n=1 Tax=Hyperionvirus sp. TaxID=2487770 RepID=A0A3G5ABI3_9VIRU|nr:MAG: hypothetical protein Hyperionvirus5_29 [Hyperionvirus sp.]